MKFCTNTDRQTHSHRYLLTLLVSLSLSLSLFADLSLALIVHLFGLFRCELIMSTHCGMENCGGEGSEATGTAAVISALGSEMALDLKPSPKQTCIPLHQRQRMVSSETR